MIGSDPQQAAGPGEPPRRLFIYNGGFLTRPRIRRILSLAGWDIRLGAPGPGDWVGVWGKSPTSPRGEKVAEVLDRPVLRIEDPFLRSVKTGQQGAPTLGLLLDRRGVHFASDTPSDLEHLLATHPLDDAALLERARVGMARIAALNLSKYNNFDETLPPPAPGYVLVIDQTEGDASIRHGGATPGLFREMLFTAMDEHPGRPVLIRSHPVTADGLAGGHFTAEDRALGPIDFVDPALPPRTLMEGAVAVYTVTSQMGFEAILAGHRPQVFGQPFYAGWGLTDDRHPVWRRKRRLTRAQLFAAAMILYPVWYDPCRDRLCSFEEMLNQLEAEVRAFRQDRRGHVAVGMRAWKRRPLQQFFGGERPVLFCKDRAKAARIAGDSGRALMVWGEAGMDGAVRVEDGFLRSRGLGAELVAPLSLITDPVGFYCDPTRESGLDRLIAAGPPPGGEDRARRLIAEITRAGLSKYNLPPTPLPDLPPGPRILVPGQVEDDASVRLGCGALRTNRALLQAVRAANPGAMLIYKPHPDVTAGLRPGAIAADEMAELADLVLPGADPAALILACDHVWTLTSTLGFEALIRGRPVTCLGTPFYAGWGLTRDLGPAPPHRRARPSVEALAHAVLIACPRYRDPVTGLPCPPETIAALLAGGWRPPGRFRPLARLQGLMAGQSWLWRGWQR